MGLFSKWQGRHESEEGDENKEGCEGLSELEIIVTDEIEKIVDLALGPPVA